MTAVAFALSAGITYANTVYTAHLRKVGYSVGDRIYNTSGYEIGRIGPESPFFAPDRYFEADEPDFIRPIGMGAFKAVMARPENPLANWISSTNKRRA
jgi:hypothetical protein